jgi:hypothetical protein
MDFPFVIGSLGWHELQSAMTLSRARMFQARFGGSTLANAIMNDDLYQMLVDASGLQRKVVKLRLLAHLYGQRPRTLEGIIGKNPARALLGALRELFPQITDLQKDSEARAKSGEPLTTLFGRPSRY